MGKQKQNGLEQDLNLGGLPILSISISTRSQTGQQQQQTKLLTNWGDHQHYGLVKLCNDLVHIKANHNFDQW